MEREPSFPLQQLTGGFPCRRSTRLENNTPEHENLAPRTLAAAAAGLGKGTKAFSAVYGLDGSSSLGAIHFLKRERMHGRSPE